MAALNVVSADLGGSVSKSRHFTSVRMPGSYYSLVDARPLEALRPSRGRPCQGSVKDVKFRDPILENPLEDRP